MTAEHIRKLIGQATDTLVAELEAGKSQGLQDYLAAIGRFRRYSLGNALLIWFTMPAATRVAGYHTWKQLGRQVRQGERGISILAPIVKRAAKEDEEETEERVVAFRPVRVFDWTQTEGRPLPEFATVKGDPGVYQQRLLEFLKLRGIVVERRQLPGSVQGMSAGGRIVISQDLAPGEQFSVIVHETAHELLHQGNKVEKLDKTIREVEAEAVAYVVSQAIGLDSNTAACDYIRLYDGNNETLMVSLERIRTVAREIIESLLVEDSRPIGQSQGPSDSLPTAMAA